MKGRAAKELARSKPQQQELSAFVSEQFSPGVANVVAPDAKELAAGAPKLVTLQLFVGQVGPGVFTVAKNATLAPDVAIGLGEYLVAEGRRVKSGLEIPVLGVPADLAA